MSNITLNSDALQALVAKTILESITQEDRDKMMVAAMTEIMAPGKDHHGRRTMSPLERAFQDATQVVANKIAREELENSEAFKAKVQKLLIDVADALFSDEIRKDLVDKITSKIIEGLNPSRY